MMGRSSARVDDQSSIRLIMENSQSITKKILLSSGTKPIQICNSGQQCGSECSFTQNVPGANNSRLLHGLSLIRFTLQVCAGAPIITNQNL